MKHCCCFAHKIFLMGLSSAKIAIRSLVTPPKDCTIGGLNEMEHAGFNSALIRGIRTSQQKARALYPKE